MRSDSTGQHRQQEICRGLADAFGPTVTISGRFRGPRRHEPWWIASSLRRLWSGTQLCLGAGHRLARSAPTKARTAAVSANFTNIVTTPDVDRTRTVDCVLP